MPAEPVSKFSHQDLFYANQLYRGENQSNTTDLYQEFNYRLSVCLKPVPSVAIFGLATLASGSVTEQVLALTEPSAVLESKKVNHLTSSDSDQEHGMQAANLKNVQSAIALPESIVVQEFTLSELSLPLLEQQRKAEDRGRDGEMGGWGDRGKQESVGRGKRWEGDGGMNVYKISTTPPRLSYSSHTPHTPQSIQGEGERVSLSLEAPEFESNSTAQPATVVSEFPIAQQEFSPLHRQNGDQLPYQPQRLPLLPNEPERKPYQANPSVTIINPSAYGASWGNAGIGIGFQERTRFSNKSDGVVGVGIGLGNPRKNVGLEVGIVTVDLLGDTLEDGAINLKIHRQLPNDFAVAAGVQGAITWGNTDGGSSVYGVVSKRFALKQDRTKSFSELHVSAGIGGGQFRSESDIDDGVDSVGGFGSIALRIIEPVSAIAEWTGQDLTVGLSVVPFRQIPLVIAPAITDLTGTAGDGSRFILGVGYGFSW
ncbi:MAG: hypothetical protein F6K16_16075 [Symploca sp. SIO2B6]|nr:hypothetical protein [Symploca sp. SIO2B6]